MLNTPTKMLRIASRYNTPASPPESPTSSDTVAMP
jgi:hypothetical protein